MDRRIETFKAPFGTEFFRRNFTGSSFGLLRSHVLWNGGTWLPIPEERIRFLHKTQEIKHPRFRGSPRQTYARKPEKSETKRLDGEIEPRVSEA